MSPIITSEPAAAAEVLESDPLDQDAANAPLELGVGAVTG